MMKIKVTQLHVHFQKKKIKPYQLPEKLIGVGGEIPKPTLIKKIHCWNVIFINLKVVTYSQ